VIAALRIKPKKSKMKILLGNPELSAFNMSEAANYFGVDPGIIAPRKRVASLAS
jgi:DNA (cytosine-5)-methyltransferase 1